MKMLERVEIYVKVGCILLSDFLTSFGINT